MDKKIISVLNELSKRSESEKKGELQTPREEQMLSITGETGKFLNVLCMGIGARRVLEIGTSVGFSTIWLAEAVRENNGKVITIEEDQGKISRAKENFQNAGLSENIEVTRGIAIDVIKELDSGIKENKTLEFDMIFVDADKENLKEYFDHLLNMVKINGLIVTDNILYPEKFHSLMQDYKQHIESKSNVRTVTVPIGNGEEVSLRLS